MLFITSVFVTNPFVEIGVMLKTRLDFFNRADYLEKIHASSQYSQSQRYSKR